MEQEIVSRQEAIERGLNRYFTGERCKNGHVAERNTINSTCISCMREATQRNRDDARKRIEAVKLAADEGAV